MTNQCVGCQDGWRPGECKICSPTANDESASPVHSCGPRPDQDSRDECVACGESVLVRGDVVSRSETMVEVSFGMAGYPSWVPTERVSAKRRANGKADARADGSAPHDGDIGCTCDEEGCPG